MSIFGRAFLRGAFTLAAAGLAGCGGGGGGGSAALPAVSTGASQSTTPVATSTPATIVPVAVQAGGSGPVRVLTWLYYGGDYENTGIPASYMAGHADFVEVGADPSYGNNFVAAGGKYAVAYTDPHLVPGCTTPTAASPGTCTGPLGSTQPESAWLHGPSGARLYTSAGQDALNPGSPATQAAYAAYTASLTAGTSLNAVMMDDTDPDYDPAYLTYKFGALPAELTALANPAGYWTAGQTALAASAAKPVIYNGGDGDAADQALATAPNVLGSILEGCAVSTAWRVNDTQGNPAYQWAPAMNKLLATTALGRYAVCLNYDVTGGDPLGDRLYALASWWLTYDPNWSVAFPAFNAPDTAGGAPSVNFAEYAIVPQGPVTSAGTNVANLKSPTGAYVREFTSCYQGGNPIGRCAAIVNPSYASTVPMPTLSTTYSHSLVLTNQSAYNGGTASWTGTVPASLSPMTAVVLRQ